MRLTRSAMRLTVLLVSLVTAAASVGTDSSTTALPAQELYPMTFPIDGPHSFTDTFGAPREGNRLHEGTDIFAEKMTPVVAVADGTVVTATIGDRAGRYIVVKHTDGWQSYYIHLNNDSPGSDDGLLDERVPGITVGAKVRAGDLLDYVGDSGNAEETPSHLHFELHAPDGRAVNPYPHLLAASGAPAAQVEDALLLAYGSLPETDATAVVGQVDPSGGFAAGIWTHNDVAYLGTWGRAQACPASGVRLIDISDPASPTVTGAIATGDEYPETDTDSVWAGAIDTDAFTGDIAVVAVSLCDNSESNRLRDAFRGLALYDMSDPATPELLGTYHTGDRTQGVHEIDVVSRPDGSVLVAATVMQSYLHTEGELGDVRLVDITDPVDPREVADWDYRESVVPVDELPPGEDEEQYHAHGVDFAGGGLRLWVAVWDGGAVLLDIDDPGRPAISDTVEDVASAEGNVHSVISAPEFGLVVVSSEDLYPTADGVHAAGWGEQLILDLAGEPLSTFRPGDSDAAGSESTIPLDGYHTAHNAQLVDQRLYSSWYSSGVRIVDLSNAVNPIEIGYFVPPPTADPQGYWTAPDGTALMPMVWDVRVVDDLLYVSDMNTGLWIVRHTGDDPLGPETY